MSIALTVCIPAYNEAANLEGLFQSLSESDLKLFDNEILLCDSGSDDGTRELYDKWVKRLNLKLIVTPNANASQNLNAGIKLAKKSIFCWIAPRSRVAKDYFSVGYRFLVDKRGTYCAIGPSVQVIPRSDKLIPNFLAKFFMSPFLMGPSKWKSSVFFKAYEGEVDTIYLGFFWTKDLKLIDGFDTALTRKQDIDLFQRLQASTDQKLFNSCDLKAIYILKHDSLKEICIRAHIQGVYAGLYPTVIRPAHVFPTICLCIFVIVSLVDPTLSLVLLGLYGMTIIVAGFLEAPRLMSVPTALMTFPIVHLSFVIGNLRGLANKLLCFIRGLI